MVKKKRLNSKKLKKIILLAIVLLTVILLGIFVIKKITSKKSEPTKIVDALDNYGYKLLDNRGNYYKSLFGELKTELNNKEVDYDKYANLISQLFITDFFTLNNKVSKNDVGGTQFVYSSFQNDFEKFAKEGIYHTVKNNIYGDRKQELPIVSNVEITNMTRRDYDYLDLNDEKAYVIDVKITYEKDLDYQREATLIIVHTDNKLEIVKMS